MILYPTETVYGLGVDALNIDELELLYTLKGRERDKSVSWLVRNIADIKEYAELPEKAAKIAEQFLPGPLTLVLKAKDSVAKELLSDDGTIGFRISSDPIATALIHEYMAEYNAPLTATSANVSGEPVLKTPKEILKQFGKKAGMIDRVVDDGARNGAPSTVVRVIGEKVEVLRDGSISALKTKQF